MTVMVQYLFQDWNLREDDQDERLRRIKDMTLDIATEEIGHVAMLATCVAMLLEGASPEQQEEAAKKDPVVYAALGGMNPQHLIVSASVPARLIAPATPSTEAGRSVAATSSPTCTLMPMLKCRGEPRPAGSTR
jgi:Mn-containing catalase